MYLLLLIPAFLLSYWILAVGFQYFFIEKKGVSSSDSPRGAVWSVPFLQKPDFQFSHILWIILVFFAVVWIVGLIPDAELANRVQHAFGGGWMIVMILYFSLRASRVEISHFQFFILSILIATAFGVANELAESLLQNFANILFAPNINDTWLDLWANTIGAFIGAIVFTYFLPKHE